MIKYKDLKKIAEIRLKEAQILNSNGYYDGATYLCGYVVETALKARICKNLNIQDYPDTGENKSIFSSHNFDRLLLLSGLQDQISISKNPQLFQNWSLLTTWKPDGRYQSIGTCSKQSAKDTLQALTQSKFGFLKWIKKQW